MPNLAEVLGAPVTPAEPGALEGALMAGGQLTDQVHVISQLHGPIFTGTREQANAFVKQHGIPIGKGYFVRKIPQPVGPRG